MIRIDGLPQTGLPARQHELPAMKDGLTVKLTVEQILSLLSGSDAAAALALATSDDTLADGDVLIYLSGADLKKAQLSGLISIIFKTSRTIENAQFATATLKLINAAGHALTHDTTALTAPRVVTWPNRAVNMNSVPAAAPHVSGQLVPSLGALVQSAHGLGAKPEIYGAYLQCTTAEFGYSVGDEIEIRPDNASTAAGYGVLAYADATNIYGRVGNTALGTTFNKGTGVGAVVLTMANWRVVLKARL